MIHISCPGCGAKFKAPDEAADRLLKCPKCGTDLPISEAVYDAEVIPDLDAPPDEMLGLDVPLSPVVGSASSSEERRPCPMCGEMIVATAAKCRYCGEVFDPALKKVESLKRGGSGGADDDLSTGDWVVAVLCSGIGCIAGIVWMIQGKPKGKKMFGVSLLFIVLWSLVQILIEAAKQQ